MFGIFFLFFFFDFLLDFLDFQWTFRIIRISLGFFFELMGFSFRFVSKVYGIFSSDFPLAS